MDKLLDCGSGLSPVEWLRCVFGNRDITKVTQNLGGGVPVASYQRTRAEKRAPSPLGCCPRKFDYIVRLWEASHFTLQNCISLKGPGYTNPCIILKRTVSNVWKNALEKTLSSSIYKCNCSYCSFFRLFGIPGVCAACSKPIAAFEFVMRAAKNAYHIECFSCQICRQRFRVGENFHFYNNKVLCWDHYRIEKEGETTTENST